MEIYIGWNLQPGKEKLTELAEKRGGIQEQIKQWHQFKEQGEPS
jgi:hypothetical protein